MLINKSSQFKRSTRENLLIFYSIGKIVLTVVGLISVSCFLTLYKVFCFTRQKKSWEKVGFFSLFHQVA